MLKILKFWSPYFLKISCPPLFEVQYPKNYSREIKNFFSHLKYMKLLSMPNILFPWRPIKRHNFKYTGQFLIKFGHKNIGSLGFGMQSFFFENLSPLMFYRPLKIRRPKNII